MIPTAGAWQFYLHPHQEDNLLAASGGRTFYLVNPGLGSAVPHRASRQWRRHLAHSTRYGFTGRCRIPTARWFSTRRSGEEGVSLVQEFRVYNSARIPALLAVTSIQASASSSPWCRAAASGGLNHGLAGRSDRSGFYIRVNGPAEVACRCWGSCKASLNRCTEIRFRGTGEHDVTRADFTTSTWIKTAPAGTWQINLGPCVQVVGLRCWFGQGW